MTGADRIAQAIHKLAIEVHTASYGHLREVLLDRVPYEMLAAPLLEDLSKNAGTDADRRWINGLVKSGLLYFEAATGRIVIRRVD